MTRFTRLFIILAILCIALSLFVMSVAQASQTVIPTPSDIERTATHIIAAATQTQMAIGTPQPAAIRASTAQVAEITRTAIAVTREPYLLTSHPPDAIELTATQIKANYEQTMMAYASPNAEELAAIYTTATYVVQRATQTTIALTENPALSLTTFPSSNLISCEMGLVSFYQDELSEKLWIALGEKAAIHTAYADIVTSGVGNQCGELYPLETIFRIDYVAGELLDGDEVVDLTERILSLLQNFPPEVSYGKVIRLQMIFRSDFQQGKYIDSGYSNAIAAYAEGLRGHLLIEALGGILDF